MANGRVRVLQAHGEETQHRRVARRVQLGDGGVEALREAREKVERDDEEGLVGLVKVEGILLVLLEVDEGLLDDRNAASEHRLRVGDEARSDGDDDRGHALQSVTRCRSGG